MEKTVKRKTKEVKSLKLKLKTASEDEAEQINDLADYLLADIESYKSVLADMQDTEFTPADCYENAAGDTECPDCYQEYLNSLSANDLENEFESDEMRCEYCEEVLDILCYDVGYEALKNKKMIKALLEDELAAIFIGDMIMQSDELFEAYEKYLGKSEKKDKKKKTK